MEVRLKPRGCVDRFGALLSFGLLPLVQRRQLRQFPARLTDDAMILRNGITIPWSAITRFKRTDAYVQGRYINTTYEIWHPGGRAHFSTRQIEDADAVVEFMLPRVPPQAR